MDSHRSLSTKASQSKKTIDRELLWFPDSYLPPAKNWEYELLIENLFWHKHLDLVAGCNKLNRVGEPPLALQSQCLVYLFLSFCDPTIILEPSKGPEPAVLTAFNIDWQRTESYIPLPHKSALNETFVAVCSLSQQHLPSLLVCLSGQTGYSWTWTIWMILFSSCECISQLANSMLDYCVDTWVDYSRVWSTRTKLH